MDSAWDVPVRLAVLGEWLGDLSLRSRAVFLCSLTQAPCGEVFYTRSAQETLLIEGTDLKGFFNQHVKSVANTSPIPAYYLLLCKVCFSMISQQCGNPDSTV